jgi:hypothetical protein
MTGKRISDFWTWFSISAQEIREELTTSGIESRAGASIGELDKRVRQISPDLRWEIGPFLDDTTFLAISPNGSKDNLRLTRKVAEAAPAIPGWRFLPAKPPKNDKRFGFDFGGVRIDTSKWHYTLVRWENPIQYGVTWIPDSEAQFDGISLDALAWFVLDSEIGEEAAISLFEFSEIAKGPTSNATRIEYFRDQFSDIRKGDAK